jgi:hypothetical protein
MEKGHFMQEFVAGNVSGLLGMTVVVRSIRWSPCYYNPSLLYDFVAW